MKTFNASTKTTKFAAIGGIVGSNIGSGRGKLVATAAGTLIGAGIGSSVANGSTGYTRPASPRTVYVP
ncbi:glycine zipper 2TM domain-containing protein, partial [uncultured Mameliella sp.]|uniref:glycine zipper 2TM domain-containing protein n=1 Tax=uncultured Mameliella sp. TaxID=1447087 RepID=UPI00345BF80A